MDEVEIYISGSKADTIIACLIYRAQAETEQF